MNLAKIFTFLILASALYSCKDVAEFDEYLKPVVSAVVSAEADEDEESIITLNYTSSDGSIATSCNLTTLNNLTLTKECSCDEEGVCTVGVKSPTNYSGTGKFLYTVTSNTLVSNESEVSVNIVNVDDAPVAKQFTADSMDEDVESLIVISYEDADSDLAVTCSLSDLLNATETTACSCDASGVCSVGITGTANYSGSASFNYKVRANDKDSNSQVVNLTINSSADAPVSSNISPASFNEDTISIVNLNYSDNDGDLATTCSISSLTNITETTACSCDAGGSCSVSVRGTSNYSGSVSFNYTVTANGQTSNSSSASLSITNVDDAPVASAMTPATFNEDTQSIITLNYSDDDSDLGTACSVGTLSNVSVSSACSCDISGVCTVGVTGTSNYYGAGSFAYTITANSVVSNSAVASLTISSVDDAPVANTITPANFLANAESVMTLSYSDIESDLATSCSLSNLSNVTVSSACSCNASGVCTVGVTGTSNYYGAASFDYTVTANSSASNSVGASFTIESLVNTSLTDPKYITATPDSISSISLFWVAGEDSLSEYSIAWAEGSTAPATCLDGNIISSASITGESYQLTGLTNPLQDYAFRLCVVDGDDKVSVGTTVVQKTLPTCDYTVSADETFADFQARMDSAVDINTDGIIAVCLSDGVDVTTSDSTEGSQIQIDTSNIYIYANRSSTVNFINNRLDTTSASSSSENNSVFYLNLADNLSIANISITSFGDKGAGIKVRSSTRTAVGIQEVSNVRFTTSGNGAESFSTGGRITKYVKDISIVSSGNDSRSISIGDELADLRKFTISGSGTCGSCPLGIDVRNNYDARNILWGTITSPNAPGISLYNASITNLENVSITGMSTIIVNSGSYIENVKDVYLQTDKEWTINLNVKSNGAYITNLENIVIVKNGRGSNGIAIANGAYIDSMNNIQIRRNAEATTGVAQAISIKDTGWVNTANVSNIEVCSVAGAVAWEDYTIPARGLLETGNSAAPTSHVAYDPGVTLGAQTFPFDVLDGSGLQGGAAAGKNIILGGICSD